MKNDYKSQFFGKIQQHNLPINNTIFTPTTKPILGTSLDHLLVATPKGICKRNYTNNWKFTSLSAVMKFRYRHSIKIGDMVMAAIRIGHHASRYSFFPSPDPTSPLYA